jgi:hypothetical protein
VDCCRGTVQGTTPDSEQRSIASNWIDTDSQSRNALTTRTLLSMPAISPDSRRQQRSLPHLYRRQSRVQFASLTRCGHFCRNANPARADHAVRTGCSSRGDPDDSEHVKIAQPLCKRIAKHQIRALREMKWATSHSKVALQFSNSDEACCDAPRSGSRR